MESGLKPFLRNIYLAEKLKGLIEQLKERAIARGLGTVAAHGQRQRHWQMSPELAFSTHPACAHAQQGRLLSVSIKIGESQHL